MTARRRTPPPATHAPVTASPAAAATAPAPPPAASLPDGDAELEKLKARRLAEMRKNLGVKRMRDEEAAKAPARQTPRDVVIASLGFRGLEVLESAEAQYPAETRLIVGRLAGIIRSENIRERLDGGQLMEVFRMLGLHVRIKTSIKVEKDGKFVSLSDKLRNDASGR